MTNEEEAKLRADIAEAETEYKALMLGTKVRVLVDQNGERVEFLAANRSALYAYIQDLKSQLPGSTVQNFTPPIGFIF